MKKSEKSPARPAPKKKPAAKWSGEVTRNSHAMDLEPNVFKLPTPGEIALSLKRSADASSHLKGTPFQSAMSMLNFYINRAGHALPPERKKILEDAKDELRKAYNHQ